MRFHHPIRPSHRQGFTLIELLVVLSIVATLLMLVSPRYTRQIDVAKEATLRENLRTTRQVIDSFHSDKGRYPRSLDELVELRYLRSLPVDPITESDATWRLIEVREGQEDGGIYDIRSGAPGTARSGELYADW